MDKFDCIVTNPPFFEIDLQSPSNEKNLASHSVALPWEELLKEVANLLLDKGTYYVLIPALRAYTMQKLAAQNGLSLAAEVVVMNAPQQKPFRVMQKFVKTNAPIQEINRSQFYIKKEDQSYSKAFIQLLAPYYLHL
jgi:tRNA1Val (adenine37-N6)-methyltransferase